MILCARIDFRPPHYLGTHSIQCLCAEKRAGNASSQTSQRPEAAQIVSEGHDGVDGRCTRRQRRDAADRLRHVRSIAANLSDIVSQTNRSKVVRPAYRWCGPLQSLLGAGWPPAPAAPRCRYKIGAVAASATGATGGEGGGMAEVTDRRPLAHSVRIGLIWYDRQDRSA